MSFADQHLYPLGVFALLFGALWLFYAFKLYRMIATGESWAEDGRHRRSERPADYWIDVVHHAAIFCVLGAMGVAIALDRHMDSRVGPPVMMAMAAMYAARALVARFVNGDDRHFRRTWWAARYWSWLLLGTAFAAFFLLVPGA